MDRSTQKSRSDQAFGTPNEILANLVSLPTHLKPLADDTPAAENNFICPANLLPIQPGKSLGDKPIETLIDCFLRGPIV